MCSTQCAVQYAEWSSDLSRGWMDFNAELTKNFCLCKQVEPAKLLSNPKILKSEFLDLKVSQSLFVNIYQRHTVLNVISDRRQFTLKSESELLLLVQLGLRRQSQRSSWGKRRSSDQSSGFRYDAVLPPSDPSSFTFPLWFIRSAGGTEKLDKYLTTFKFHF